MAEQLRAGSIPICEGLGGAEVGEEVADLLIGEIAELVVGHEGEARGAEVFDFFAGEGDVLAVGAADDDDAEVLVGDEAGEGAAVVGSGDEIFEAFADFGARVHDVEEHAAEVVALVGGEVGADLAALAEEGVALAAHLVVELLALIRIALGQSDDAAELFDLGAQLVGRGAGELAPMFFAERGNLWRIVE